MLQGLQINSGYNDHCIVIFTAIFNNFIFNKRIELHSSKPTAMKLILAAWLFLIFNACTPKQEQANTEIAATDNTKEKNKELIRNVYTEMVNKRNYKLIDSFFALDIVDHGALEGQEQGREGFKKAVTEFLNMFSQLEVKQQEIMAEGDMVATRETWKVTMASTNKELSDETMHWFHIKDGLITDEWSKGWKWLGL